RLLPEEPDTLLVEARMAVWIGHALLCSVVAGRGGKGLVVPAARAVRPVDREDQVPRQLLEVLAPRKGDAPPGARPVVVRKGPGRRDLLRTTTGRAPGGASPLRGAR